MIGRLLAILVLVVSGVVGLSYVARADGCGSSPTSGTQGASGLTGILISGEEASLGASCGSTASATEAITLPPRDADLDTACVREALSTGRDPFQLCDLPSEAGEVEVTPGIVGAAFRRIPLPAAELIVQPPGGRTLVNFETNFYTERDEFTRAVTLLGRRVVLRIWPERFGWRFGDGHIRWTSTPGAKYPDLEVTHRYLQAGRVMPSVATTYAAQFRVGGGPWRDVAGTVTIPGTPEGLRVVTARPVLVGGS